MTYEETLAKIFALHRFQKVPGLAHLRSLLHILGDPQERLSFVHVAGTNGKGSTSTMIASMLRKSGYRTGLFVSPFVTDFCERIQLNNRPISHRNLAQAAEEVFPPLLKLEQSGQEISEFEAITALALYWFAQQACEVVVLEVGLGGRLDATNVIRAPLCAVLTHISYDHTEILGNTLTQIATEKCGILKEGCEVVTAAGQDSEALAVIRRTAQERHCRLTETDPALLQVAQETLTGTRMLYGTELLEMSLLGAYQVTNAAAALTCAQVLRTRKGLCRMTKASVAAGLAAARMPARFEVVSRRPLVVIDGAHNPDGARALAESLRRYLPGKHLVALTGMCADKDTAHFVQTLAPLFAQAVTLSIQNPRTLQAEALAALWRRAGVETHTGSYAAQALAYAVQLAGADGAVVVCGSLYFAGELRPIALEMLPLLR
ncbi:MULTISPECIES: bifunctional folylpolyglutamate synthase/dihydrofolate synthase [Caproicibacterium]|uniref:tetrahydrofolate synthase n=1 Tax=Caproicibacterium argilliputei TaxID=3030016 RepID=A0AA97D9H7_9FIRM|nr:folylpolyglutamate synthase/dihydrofolate synthase family protein [Caproicibacterium argilliputei]WOC32726.1 folylpolyglutamate synthase/dihydrofolate synthase family protein [Caproicibacterium argilliputei]